MAYVKHVLLSLSVAVLATMCKLWYGTLFQCIGVLTLVGAGVYFGVAITLQRGKKHEIKTKKNLASVANAILKQMVAIRQNFHPCEKRVVISRNLDAAIEDIMDLTVRDYIMTWYSELSEDRNKFPHIVKDEMWGVIEKLTERLKRVDMLHFMTNDVASTLHKHFQDIRLASANAEEGEEQAKFVLHPWLESDESETEFLRTVADVLLIHLIPDEYARVQSVRHLLREILACSVIKPTIDLLCEPDFINETLYNWLDYREQLAWAHAAKYTHAPTYEQFMMIIEKCDDLEHLKQLRYNIITEIVQATTIQHFKRLKGQDIDKEYVPKGTSKGDLLRARNLSRYINQLAVCKRYCEKRIHLLGGPDYKSYTSAGTSTSETHVPGRKVLSFSVVMETEEARNYLYKFLCKSEDDALLRFWASVENMKHSQRKHWHKQAGEMYEMYLANPGSLLRLHLEKSLIKRMEAFMTGDQGPEAFYEAQRLVTKTLEEQHYPSFILSDLYQRYIRQTETSHGNKASVLGSSFPRVQRDSDTNPANDDLTSSVKSSASAASVQDRERIGEHCTYAHEKLRSLDEKCVNKTQALHALKYSHKNDDKILKLQEEIEKEIEQLKTERRQLEFHVERTDLWAANVGQWKANIYSFGIVEESGKKVPYFVIVVHLPGMAQPHMLDSAAPVGPAGSSYGGDAAPSSKKASTTPHGWVVSRKLDEFQALHKKLKLLNPSLKISEYSRNALKGKGPDGAKLNVKQLKEGLGEYLSCVLKDEQLSHSEAVFVFFSPSPEQLKQPFTTHKTRDKFSLIGLFKSLPVSRKVESSDSEDDLIFAGDDSTKLTDTSKAKDSAASTIYKLIGEVFEVKGVFKWFRKTFIIFVKVTFGKSVNKQLRSLVDWVCSEPMVIYYLHLFRDRYWPDGQLGPIRPARSDEEKLRTRFMAKAKFTKNIPDVLTNLVGDRNAKRGAIKTFEVLQEHRLNKHLFYNIMLLILYELFPEINESYQQSVEAKEECQT